MKIILELCTDNVDSAVLASPYVDRLELCTALSLGGLSATVGQVKAIKAKCDVKINALLRPRQAGFCYSDLEFRWIVEEAKALVEAGADGLVFGFLDQKGEIDILRTKTLVEIAGELDTTFHRAFDLVPNWQVALDQLIELKLKRVLTSGQAKNAEAGLENLKKMQEYSQARIKIMAGAGINQNNLQKIIQHSKIKEIHGSFSHLAEDNTVYLNPEISFNQANLKASSYYALDQEYLKKIRRLTQ